METDDDFNQRVIDSISDVLGLIRAYLFSPIAVIRAYRRVAEKNPEFGRLEKFIDAGFVIVDRREAAREYAQIKRMYDEEK